MAKTGITTSLTDTALGQNVSDESISMLVCDAPAISTTFLQNTPYLITSTQDAINLGITQEWEEEQLSSTGSRLYTNITDFYSQATSGTKLWIVGSTFTYGASGTLSSAEFYSTLSSVVMKTVQNGYANRPRILMVAKGQKAASSTDYEEGTINNTYDYTDIAALQSFIDDMFTANSIRMVAIYDGAYLQPETTGILQPAELDDASGLNASNVAYLITDIHGYGLASVGHAGGILANRSIQSSIGNVSLGSVAQTAYFTNVKNTTGTVTQGSGTPVSQMNNTNNDIIGTAGYLFLRTRPMVSGLFYNDGATCNLSTNALSKLETVRVGNAVCDDAEAYLTQFINVNIPVNSDGTILTAYKATMESDFYSRYILPRLNAGQASDISVEFSEKDGNYVQSKSIQCTVQILPSSAMEQGYINVFFVSTL